MTQWYKIKEYSPYDTHFISDAVMFPIETIVRVLERRGEKDEWLYGVTLEAHPDLIDNCVYMRFYFGVRLHPIDDLKVFKMLVERTNAGVI